MARKESALFRWMPRKTRNRVKAALQRINSVMTPPLLVNPSLAAKLYAYKPYANEFVVAGPEPEGVERDADGIPVPPRDLRVGEISADDFCAGGAEDVDAMRRVLADSGLALERFPRMLDFGCSSGRMIRRLVAQARESEVWGVDIASEHIYWCQRYLSPPLRFATVTTSPHLPFEDRYFSFVYAGSVFTHLDDLADAWLLELRRILKPGGHAYITVHDDETLRIMESNRHREEWYDMVIGSRAYAEFRRRRGRMFTIGRSLMAYVFYDTEYLLAHVSTLFDLTSVTPRVYRDFQTGLLLQKRHDA